MTLEEIEAQIAEHLNALPALRARGLELLADQNPPASEAVQWLVNRGVSLSDARKAVASSVLRRRAARRNLGEGMS